MYVAESATQRPGSRTLCDHLEHLSTTHYIVFHSMYCRRRDNDKNIHTINVLNDQSSTAPQLKLVKPGSAGMLTAWA